MRISYDIALEGLAAINHAAEALATAQRQVSTGRRILRAGDAPLDAQLAVGEHAGLASIDAYSRSRDGAAARLAAADSVLAGIADKLTSAQTTAVAAGGSFLSTDARSALAAEVRALRDALLADINTTFRGSYLFSGTEAKTAAYANVGGAWTYQGNADVLTVDVADGRSVDVSFDGRSIAQGSDAVDVFTVLDDLATALAAGESAAIQGNAAAVGRALDRTLRAQGQLGADTRGLDEAAMRLMSLKTAAETRRSALEDTNLAEAITRMTQADSAYQAALASVSTAERLTLLDYLR